MIITSGQTNSSGGMNRMNKIEMLAKPFPPEAVSWRVGSVSRDKTKGMALAYVDARDVMDRLDDVVGPMNWQARYSHITPTVIICEIGINGDDRDGWVWKANGAGETKVEAAKGAASDAFKRAAVLWGIGRYLYELKSPWVALDDFQKIKPEEYKKLWALLTPTQTPLEMAQDFVDQIVFKLSRAESDDVKDSIIAENEARITRLKEGYPKLYTKVMEA